MSRLAQDYGTSGNGLAKICDRLNVPYPPRGYWAKKAAGKKVVQYRLPDRADGTPQTATISPTPPPVSPPEIAPDVQQQVDAAKQAVGAVAVPARLVRPHPVIGAWLAEREEERLRARRERDPWRRNLAPPDWSESERRRHRILDALFKAAERQDIRIKQPDRFTVFFEASGERIDFKLREKQRQVRKPKTPDEIKRLLPGEKTWRQELQPTGVLTFSIETYLPALQRRAWTETADQPLEEQATRWRQADEVRRFLEVLTQHADVAASLTNGESVSEWLSWARTRLAAFDPLAAGATGVFEDLLKITAWTYRQ